MKRLCKNYMHLLISVQILATFSCFAESGSLVARAPANFVPDDDMIVVPMLIERNFMDDFHEKHKSKMKSAKKKLQYWISQEQYAEDYGLEGTGIVNLPTNEQKEQFLQKHYLRFLSKDLEKATNGGIKNSWEEWTADDEIDAIEAIKLHEKVLVKARNNSGKPALKSTSSVKVGKDNLKFGFQARPEIGMAKFTVKSKYFYARAWVGINGSQELNVERTIKATKTKLFTNYYVDETRLLAAADQPLSQHWKIRLTHSKDFDDFEEITTSGVSENNILQLKFHMGF